MQVSTCLRVGVRIKTVQFRRTDQAVDRRRARSPSASAPSATSEPERKDPGVRGFSRIFPERYYPVNLDSSLSLPGSDKWSHHRRPRDLKTSGKMSRTFVQLGCTSKFVHPGCTELASEDKKATDWPKFVHPECTDRQRLFDRSSARCRARELSSIGPSFSSMKHSVPSTGEDLSRGGVRDSDPRNPDLRPPHAGAASSRSPCCRVLGTFFQFSATLLARSGATNHKRADCG